MGKSTEKYREIEKSKNGEKGGGGWPKGLYVSAPII